MRAKALILRLPNEEPTSVDTACALQQVSQKITETGVSTAVRQTEA